MFRSQVPGTTTARVALATFLVIASGCKGGTAPTPVPIPGATIVRGTERLAWTQAGHVSGLRFRAYVDDVPVLLESATCDAGTPEASCSSPLPPMNDGVHTIALTSLLGADLESERSESLLIQKASGGTSRLASLREADPGGGAVSLRSTLQLSPGLVFDADVVARGIRAPAQMASTPDGRLFVAEADGAVRVVRPDDGNALTNALDARHTHEMFRATSAAASGLAVHPSFAGNRFVYLARLVDNGARGWRLRVIRLREAGNTLGEPAQIFETPVTGPASATLREAPALAFGPDRLLYVALPAGFTFDREPAASRPHPAMLRLDDEGRVAGDGPIDGVRAHPAAFTWDPATGAIWLAFAERGVSTFEPLVPVRELTYRNRTDARQPSASLRVPTEVRRSPAANTLVIRDTANLQTHQLALRLLRTPVATSTVRLTMPVSAGTLSSDRLGDFVSGPDGAWYVLTVNGDADVIVKIKTSKK